MTNVRLHIVDIGSKEDMKSIPSLLTSNFGENECMIRKSELFVSRLLPIVPSSKESSVNDTIIHLNPTKEENVAFRLEPSETAQLSSLQFHTYNIPSVPSSSDISFFLFSFFFLLFNKHMIYF